MLINDMGSIKILQLNQPQSKIRISDKNGNHQSRPTEVLNTLDFLVEWMITNDECENLCKEFLTAQERNRLVEKLKEINKFVNESKYTKREAVKSPEVLESFLGFEITKYAENFYSFEKQLDSGIRVRITFKQGDYGIDPHPQMYALLPFNHPSIKIKNIDGVVSSGDPLGKKCKAEWSPSKKDVEDITITLSQISIDHRDKLIDILKSLI